MNKGKGFTLVELLAVIVILAIILAIAIPGISGIIKSATKGAFESDAKMVLTAINYQKMQNDAFDVTSINKDTVLSTLKLSNDNYESVTTTLVNNKVKVVIAGKNKWAGLTAYGYMTNMTVVDSSDYDVTAPVITVAGENTITVEARLAYTDAGAIASDNHDGDISSDIVMTGTVNVNVAGSYTLTYNVSDANGNAATPVTRTVIVEDPYDASEGVNKPKLASGMIPVKWSTDHWITTTNSDADWYQYGTTTETRNWANVIQVNNPSSYTTPGTTVNINDVIAFWVWIPRYVYRISTGWHLSNAGTIDVQFSMGRDDTRDGTVTLDTGTTANASNNKWTNHPAFTFGSTQVMGIWVAKFEASNPGNSTVKIVPGVESWSSITVDTIHAKTRSMETNTIYGWGMSGTDIDTHLIKNIEWGAATYLAKSTYGKNTTEIWINPTPYAGCAGDDVAASTVISCLRAYSTPNGMKASTTGTIYGIYDMSGGAYEYVAAYIDNHSATTSGGTLLAADEKYRDVYTKAGTDSAVNNYDLAVDTKGDAMYETSSSVDGKTSWFGEWSYMAQTTDPWFTRGGFYGGSTSAGTFAFERSMGSSGSAIGFRPVLLVGTGL